jgi:hypothetical protein
VSWVFAGPPEVQMRKILGDLERARHEDGHLYRDQAFVSLVGRSRSALQVIVDDYASTPVPGWLHPEEFDGIDDRIRTSARWQYPIGPDRIPSRLARTHWWWTLPAAGGLTFAP